MPRDHESTPSPAAWPASRLSEVRGLPRTVAQLHVELLDVEPAVWRRVLVPHAIALRSLHQTLQVVMGWDDAHLWEFRVGTDDAERGGPRGTGYGEPDPDWPDATLRSATGVRLRTVAPLEGARLLYLYDFGDNWRHRVTVEALLPNLLADVTGGEPLPYCVTGARACPPEDCGGAGFYSEYVAALEQTRRGAGGREGAGHGASVPEDIGTLWAELRVWAGGDFDPAAFSARQVNRELRLRRRQTPGA